MVSGPKKQGLVFKLDFEKAYVHVSWTFLDKAMDRKGFGARCVNKFQGVYLLPPLQLFETLPIESSTIVAEKDEKWTGEGVEEE